MGNRRLGKSAIVVSDICMGTMTFGSQADEAVAHRVLDMSLDAGINFFDTAEGYPVPPDVKWVGRTEEIVGRWLKGKNRDAIIIATKVSGPSHVWFKSPKRGGMTRSPTTTAPTISAQYERNVGEACGLINVSNECLTSEASTGSPLENFAFGCSRKLTLRPSFASSMSCASMP